MKAREIEDAWRHVAEKVYPVRLDRFEFSRLLGFQDGYLRLGTGVNIISGGNGVGKSTLLHAAYALLERAGARCEGYI